MALILAIDSGGDAFAAALGHTEHADDPTTRLHPGLSQAAVALPLIQQLLAEQRVNLQQCDAFAFAAGPGKFSALRLACGIAQTFAYACAKPLLAVPTFAALAQANYGNRDITVKCALPAHRDHIYAAICDHSGGEWRVRRSALRHCDAAPLGKTVPHACGAGYAHHPHLLAAADYTQKAPTATAAAVWRIAATMWTKQDTSDPFTCEPIYLRRKIAQTVRERQCITNS